MSLSQHKRPAIYLGIEVNEEASTWRSQRGRPREAEGRDVWDFGNDQRRTIVLSLSLSLSLIAIGKFDLATRPTRRQVQR